MQRRRPLMWLALIVTLAWMPSGSFAADTSVKPSATQRSASQNFYDADKRYMGRIVTKPDGREEARGVTAIYLGAYDPTHDITYDRFNRVYGRGDQLAAIIAAEYTAYRARQKAEMPIDVDPQAPVIGPLTDMSDESSNRRGAMSAALTTEDRIIARQALDRAGQHPFNRVEWSNPRTGNYGSFFVREVDRRSSRWLNGEWVECRFNDTEVHATGLTNVEHQTVCPVNGAWMVVLVNGDR